MLTRRGVTYDVGRVIDGDSTRRMLDWAEVRRELQIIRDDLHCTAVKIHGEDLSRLSRAAEVALDLGLEVWLGPDLWDHDADATLDYIRAAARAAEDLRRHAPQRVFLSMATELSLMMRGILPGATLPERIARVAGTDTRNGRPAQLLDDFLARAVPAVREVFAGPLTYCALLFERVNWSRFDIIGVDLYRDAAIRDRYPRIVEQFCSRGKPMIVGEFGCCTYAGADLLGGAGWDIFDHTADPPRLAGVYRRDEAGQAREITECLAIFDRAGVDGAFVHTFVSPLNPTHSDPRFDFDLGSYGIVRSDASRIGDLSAQFPTVPWDTTPIGSTYPDLPWEPKQAFHAVADCYARSRRRTA